MLKDAQGRRLWIVDEFGRHAPAKDPADILARRRSGDEPDWWVVARDPDWTPPEAKSLLSLRGSATDGATGETAVGHTKIGAGHKPQPYDEQGRYLGTAGAALGRMAEGVGQALRQGAAAAKTALARTAHELRTNEELRKGVEFGARAAAEVSKDVFARAGADAVGAYLGHRLKGDPGEPNPAQASGAAGSLLLKGVRLYHEAPAWGHELGDRLQRIKHDVYPGE